MASKKRKTALLPLPYLLPPPVSTAVAGCQPQSSRAAPTETDS